MTMRLAVALLVAAATQACAQPAAGDVPPSAVPARALFSKAHWQVATAGCPIGCSDATRAFLQSQVGRDVQLSTTQFAAAFDDPCEGTLHYDVRSVPATAVVAEVNKGVAPAHRKMVPADLKLDPNRSTTMAIALCHGAAGDMTQARLLSVEADRILVLFEEQSIIELR